MGDDGDGAIPVAPDELDLSDRGWLKLEDVDLADERVVVVRQPDRMLGFDVATGRGVVLIRHDDTSVQGAWVGGELTFSGLDMSTFGRPWVITSGPEKMVGTRYAAAGEAIRAALRGFPWPEGWPADMERVMPVDLPDRTVSMPGFFIDEPPPVFPYLTDAGGSDVPRPDRSMGERIEASSLGTPEARALRESVPEEVGQAIVARSKEIAGEVKLSGVSVEQLRAELAAVRAVFRTAAEVSGRLRDAWCGLLGYAEQAVRAGLLQAVESMAAGGGGSESSPVRFFGERWDAPQVDDAVQVPTPVGESCLWCAEPVADGDRGLIRVAVRMVDGAPVAKAEPVHAECDLIGAWGHDVGVCSCTGYDTGTREAARLVWERVGQARGRDLADRGPR